METRQHANHQKLMELKYNIWRPNSKSIENYDVSGDMISLIILCRLGYFYTNIYDIATYFTYLACLWFCQLLNHTMSIKHSNKYCVILWSHVTSFVMYLELVEL